MGCTDSKVENSSTGSFKKGTISWTIEQIVNKAFENKSQKAEDHRTGSPEIKFKQFGSAQEITNTIPAAKLKLMNDCLSKLPLLPSTVYPENPQCKTWEEEMKTKPFVGPFARGPISMAIEQRLSGGAVFNIEWFPGDTTNAATRIEFSNGPACNYILQCDSKNVKLLNRVGYKDVFEYEVTSDGLLGKKIN